VLPLLLQDSIFYQEFVPYRLFGCNCTVKLLGSLSEKRSQHKKCEEMGRRAQLKNIQLLVVARLYFVYWSIYQVD
jgi:hypothetical protein